MKIIEVILSNDDSESDGEDIVEKKKQYEMLKEELYISTREIQLDLQSNELN
jgi:hypothetical protein